jgi:thioester reductase-like protein
MRSVFFTGFPGFLGSRLLPRVLARDPEQNAICLVQEKFAAPARERAAELVAAHPELEGRIHFASGDITRSGLALDRPLAHGEVTEIYHLAAVYDLSVPRATGLAVNLEGTRNILALAAECPRLERFQYVSTCYVSGRYRGLFTEADLDVGQKFNNYYEETKFLAEVEVQEAMRGGLPGSIYRPSVVVGDSRTGETQKYDGPYVVIRWLLRQPAVAVLPVVGDTTAHTVNVVPSDFVLDALAWLSALPGSRGKVFQLADPDPLTVDEMIGVLAEATRRKVLRVPLPRPVAKGMIDYVPFVERVLGIPSASVDYFVHPTRYATDNTRRELAGSGIACPPFATYARTLVEYVETHPEVSAKGMV